MKTMKNRCLIVCLSLFVLPSVLLSENVRSNLDDFLKTKTLAEQGYAKAQFNLGVMYYQGDGVLRNYAKALEWYKQAAEQGDAYSILGRCTTTVRG